MADIKPIPTTYGGIKFRSRLEARWAVFFDALGLRFDYEPEGFQLSGGVRYLPDFWVRNLGVFAEVKPDGGDFRKARRFAVETGRSIWLCEGTPDFRVTTLVYGDGGGESAVIPCADQAMDCDGFFYEPGYEDRQGYFDSSMAGRRYSLAVQAANTYPFWNPTPAGGAYA